MDASQFRPAEASGAAVPAAALLADLLREFDALRRLGEGALAQLDEHEWRSSAGVGNPVAVTVKHLAGNMRSRWRDVLTTDGEKPDRDRDAEFELRPHDTPERLLEHWREGWDLLTSALEQAGSERLTARVTIRGEPHTLLQAALRQLSHYAYHVGQIVHEARARRGDGWRSLSIPKGGSATFDATARPYLGAGRPAEPRATVEAREPVAAVRPAPAPTSQEADADATPKGPTLARIRDLWRHLTWADERMLAALVDDEAAALARREAAHVIGTAENWLARVEQREPRAPIWPDLPLSALRQLAASTRSAWSGFLAARCEADLARPVTYTNSEGRSFTNALGDILLHVALHGQYHRGRVNLALRLQGRPAAPADYIAFVRGAPAATEASSAAARGGPT